MNKPITAVWASGREVIINVPSPTGGSTDSYNFVCTFASEQGVTAFVQEFRKIHNIPTY